MAVLTTSDIVNVNLYVGYSATAASAFEAGLILGSSSVISETDRVKKYSGISDVLTDFGTDADEYKAAALYFSQSPAPDTLYIGRIGTSESPAVALDACFTKVGSFWGVYMCGATKENAVDIDTYLSAAGSGMQFISAVSYAAAVAEDGAFAALAATKSKHTCGIVATETHAGAAMMGRTIGMGAGSTTAFALCYKTLEGITTIALTSTQIDAVKALNGNVYVTRGYTYDLIEQGTTFHGLRVDEVYYLDRMTADIQNAVMGIMTGSYGKLPQTDEGSARLVATIKNVLVDYVNIGFLGAGVWYGSTIGSVTNGSTLSNGYVVNVDSYSTQSQADREAHKAMPIQVGVTLAGSVESVEINVYAQV